MAKRNGSQLSLIERNDAVLRVLAGESVAAVAAWLRVQPQRIDQWIKPQLSGGEWLYRTGPWGRVTWDSTGTELAPEEVLAGCEMVDIDDEREKRISWRTRKVHVGKPRQDPKLVEAMYRTRRELFVYLLTTPPPDMQPDIALDQHERVYTMLAGRDRDDLGPAWDAYQLAAECWYDAKRKVAAIVDLVGAEVAA